MLEFEGVKISWLGHDGFRISNGTRVYIDPYQIKGGDKADLILISHEHFDHCNANDVNKVSTEKTTIVTIPSARDELTKGKVKAKEIKTVRPGDKLSLGEVAIEVVPAYNLNKFRAPGKVFHPKEDGKVGFIVSIKGVRIYHTGDSDHIPEMKNIKADIALLPVSGTYVMTAEEAVEAAKTIKPKLAIPMHFGAIVGDRSMAEKFAKTAGSEVKILEKEE